MFSEFVHLFSHSLVKKEGAHGRGEHGSEDQIHHLKSANLKKKGGDLISFLFTFGDQSLENFHLGIR